MDTDPDQSSPVDAAAVRLQVAELEAQLARARRRGEHAEEACQALTRVLEATSDAFVALDADWRYTYVNARAAALFGREPAELLGKHIWTEFPEGVGQPFHLAYERAVAEGRPQQVEAYYPPLDRWFENRIFPHGGGVAVFFQDVTERRLGEARLRESEARHRAMVEQSLGGVYVIQHGRYTYVNPRFCEMVGYRAEELYALPSTLDLVHEDDRAMVAERLRRRVAGDVVSPSQFRVIRKDGAIVYVEAHSRPVELENGPALVGFQVDVTDRVRAEAQLRQAHDGLRTLLEASPLATVGVDAAGRVVVWNPAAERVFGWTAAEVLGRPAPNVPADVEDAREGDRALWSVILDGETFTGLETRQRRKDGTLVDVSHSAAPLPGADGRPVGAVCLYVDVTARNRAERARRESERRFQGIFEGAAIGIRLADLAGRSLDVNPALCAMLGYSADELLGRPLDPFTHPDDVAAHQALCEELLAGSRDHGQLEQRYLRRDGSVLWGRLTVSLVRDDHDQPKYVVAMVEDVSDRVRAQAALRESEERFRAMIEHSPEAIALHAHGRLLYLNPAGARLLGVPDPEALVGTPVVDFMDADSRAVAQEQLGAALESGTTHVGPTTYRLIRRDDGRVLDVEVTSVRGTFAGRAAMQSHLQDVTERRALEAQLTHQAFHDPLTGLANRVLFHDRVEHALTRTRRGEHMAVTLLDLDDFKTVNDSLGHAAGDELLTAVAGRLAHAARGADTVARLGGDEFALLLEGLAHEDDVGAALERVRAALRGPVLIAGREVPISASLGVAHARDDEGPAELLRNADVAMYRAKAQGKGRVAIFAPEMHVAAVERLELEADLRAGLARGEFRLVFQPLVHIATGRVLGAEALVRWMHPTRGTVSPVAFIPVAEQTGLIVPLGRWVLEEACRQAAAWDAPGGGEWQAAVPFPGAPGAEAGWVHVNISGRQLQEPDFLHHVVAALTASGLAPGRLVLEITESVLLHDAEASLARLLELKALGVRLALDDFGTGYSSLAYLQRFPIDVLKLDKSFIDGLGRDAGQAAVPRGIVALGHALRMATVAEGIETAMQCGRLRELGCDVGQGHLFAEPLAPRVFATLLHHGHTVVPPA